MSDALNQIKFYHRGQEYYEFTNFAEGYPFNFPSLSGYENLAGSWATSEHAFQAAKFLNNREIVERFRGLSTPREAFDLAGNLAREKNGETKTKIIDNWHGKGSGSWENDGSNAKKIEIMRLIVEQKILQNKDLKKLLLETGDKEIIEDTASDTSKPENKRDDCWGNAGIGKNWLGKILMGVREKLRTEERSSDPPPPNNPEPSPQKPEPNKPEPEVPSPSKDQPNPGNQNETPTDNQNPQKNNPSPAPSNNPAPVLPPTDPKEITEAKDISQARANAKKQIQQIFQKSNLSNVELKKELQNWESQLENLDDKQKIIELVEQIKNEINHKLEIINRKNNQTGSPSKPNFLPLYLTIGVSVFLALSLVIYINWRKRKKIKKR